MRSREIQSIVARPPSRSFLTGLRVSECTIPKEYMAPLLQTAGRELRNIDLSGFDWQIVPGLTECCPRLEGLTVKDQSQVNFSQKPPYEKVWSGSPCMRLGSLIPPTVRELHLYLTGPFQPLNVVVDANEWARHLPNLEALYMACSRSPTAGELDEFLRPVLRTLPRLQRLMWLNVVAKEDEYGDPVPMPSLSYAQKRFVVRSMLGDLTEEDQVAVVTSSGAAALALLSVVDTVDAEQRAVGRLSRDTVRHIMGFARDTVPRELWMYQFTRR